MSVILITITIIVMETPPLPSVFQAHEHPEIDERLDGVEGRPTNLEQGQADIKTTLQKRLEKQ